MKTHRTLGYRIEMVLSSCFLASVISIVSTTPAENSSIQTLDAKPRGHLTLFYSELAAPDETSHLTFSPWMRFVKKPEAVQTASLHPAITAEIKPKAKQTWAGLMAPLETGQIFSLFGNRCRILTKKCEPHNGVDIAVETGTRIKAAHKGTVTVGHNPFLGHFIKIDFGNRRTEYGHLHATPKRANGTKLKTGDTVAAGEIIGIVGESGNAEGPHLHFSLLIDGQYVDPLLHIKALADLPVRERYKAQVEAIRATHVQRLSQR